MSALTCRRQRLGRARHVLWRRSGDRVAAEGRRRRRHHRDGPHRSRPLGAARAPVRACTPWPTASPTATTPCPAQVAPDLVPVLERPRAQARRPPLRMMQARRSRGPSPATASQVPWGPGRSVRSASEQWAALLEEVGRPAAERTARGGPGPGALPSTQAQRDEASEMHFDAMCEALVLEAAALPVLTRWRRPGSRRRCSRAAPWRTSTTRTRHSGLFADVDLLVRSADLDSGRRRSSCGLGHVRRSVEPRAGFDRRFGKGATFTSAERSRDRPAPHLRHGAVRAPAAPGRPVGAPGAPSSSPVGGSARSTPSAASCTPATTRRSGDAEPRLVPQRDIAQMALFGELDLDRVHVPGARLAGRAGRRACRDLAWPSCRLRT